MQSTLTIQASQVPAPLTRGLVSRRNAIVYVGLRDLDNAFEWLDRARKVNDPWFTENGFDLMFDPLRADPRWIRLRKRMGLGA
ncbi:MAG: hypothetical protein ACREMA_05365 [Longimicrobiales bacterium]